MPTVIRLTTMPGKIRRGRLGDSLVLDLFGGSLDQEDILIRKPGDVAPAGGPVDAVMGLQRADIPGGSLPE